MALASYNMGSKMWDIDLFYSLNTSFVKKRLFAEKIPAHEIAQKPPKIHISASIHSSGLQAIPTTALGIKSAHTKKIKFIKNLQRYFKRD